jgi:hypothetical protein
MSWRIASPVLASAWMAALACSTRAPLPPQGGDCVPFDGGSCGVAGGGGGVGGPSTGGDAGGVCTVNQGDSLCDQCLETSCCAEVNACEADSACQPLATCIENCVLSTCISGCDARFPSGVAPYGHLTSCASAKCPVCAESGVGDPCNLPCLSGLTCSGSYCTKACVRGSDCAGIGPGGDNLAGAPNACLETSRGPECAAGCTTNAQCTNFPGTYCQSTTSADGLAVQVCAAIFDAGAD